MSELEKAQAIASEKSAKLKRSIKKHFNYTILAHGLITVRPKTRKGKVICYLVSKAAKDDVSYNKGDKEYSFHIPPEIAGLIVAGS